MNENWGLPLGGCLFSDLMREGGCWAQVGYAKRLHGVYSLVSMLVFEVNWYISASPRNSECSSSAVNWYLGLRPKHGFISS